MCMCVMLPCGDYSVCGVSVVWFVCVYVWGYGVYVLCCMVWGVWCIWGEVCVCVVWCVCQGWCVVHVLCLVYV